LVDAILEYTGMARLPRIFVQEGQVAATIPLFNSEDGKHVSEVQIKLQLMKINDFSCQKIISSYQLEWIPIDFTDFQKS
jgi:hypothetical protein